VKNPWLDIPLADYEGHMALPYVAQAQLLSDVFAGALEVFTPRSVAVLGCAGGNGFERISPLITDRLVGVDLNPEYILEVQRRFGDRIPALELFVGDIQKDEFNFLPVELVFASLLFEYVDVGAALARIHSMLTANGRLVTVLQLPNSSIPEVTPSPYKSLSALSPVMQLVSPDLLERLAAGQGYQQTGADVVESAGGKLFQVQTFCLAATKQGR
jgi:SAM-dependent methyltransferase